MTTLRRRTVLAATLAVAGCSLLPSQPYVERRDWPLDVRRATASPPRRGGKILLVRTVTAAPQLQDSGLQWLQNDGSVHVDYYERWVVPPGQAVDDDLRQWLAASGLYAAVLAPGSRMTADLVLEGQLNTFMADLPAKTARADVSVVLLDQRPTTTTVVMQRSFRAEVKLDGTDIPQIVEGLRAALRQVLEQIEAALTQHL